jgi:hypothetical protein
MTVIAFIAMWTTRLILDITEQTASEKITEYLQRFNVRILFPPEFYCLMLTHRCGWMTTIVKRDHEM